MNIEIEYLYRDGGNNKKWNRVVFANPHGRSPSYIAAQIREWLVDEMFFNAADVRLTEARFADYDAALDHGWHECPMAELTDEEPRDEFGRTIDGLVRDFTRSLEARGI